jgi:hypothetical protein
VVRDQTRVHSTNQIKKVSSEKMIDDPISETKHPLCISKASLNGEFHRPGFQDVKLWYEIDVSLNA